jgi:hypothetical protein
LLNLTCRRQKQGSASEAEIPRDTPWGWRGNSGERLGQVLLRFESARCGDIIPVLGGAERRVRNALWNDREFDEVFWFVRLSWSPDRKLLAISDRASLGEVASIFQNLFVQEF